MELLGLGILLVIAGLIFCYAHSSVRQSGLATVVYWVGIILVVAGLILVATPVLIWLNTQVRSALGK